MASAAVDPASAPAPAPAAASGEKDAAAAAATTTTSTAGAGVMEIAPNHTIYINNLNERVGKDALKKALYAVFSQFGKIIDIVALKTLKLRGQAWIVFEDIASATNALRQMQGFPFYDKPMRIQFAKTKSDAVAKRDGTWVPREKRKRLEEAKEAARGSKAAKPSASSDAPAVLVPKPAQKRRAMNAVPHNILFAEQLPAETTQEVLTKLFVQYPGLKEVRLIAGKGVAFIEFQDIPQATIALQALNNFKLNETHNLLLSYGKQ